MVGFRRTHTGETLYRISEKCHHMATEQVTIIFLLQVRRTEYHIRISPPNRSMLGASAWLLTSYH